MRVEGRGRGRGDTERCGGRGCGVWRGRVWCVEGEGVVCGEGGCGVSGGGCGVWRGRVWCVEREGVVCGGGGCDMWRWRV